MVLQPNHDELLDKSEIISSVADSGVPVHAGSGANPGTLGANAHSNSNTTDPSPVYPLLIKKESTDVALSDQDDKEEEDEEEDFEDKENERILGVVPPVRVSVESLYLQPIPTKRFGFLPPSKPKMKADNDLEKNGDENQQEKVKPPILSDINLEFPPNTLTAIIGGSGSGKTSLLNSLAKRMASSSLKTSGLIYFNGSADIDSVSHAFVLQQDILQVNLTCRETLRYAADLRLPGSKKADRRFLVESVIRELGLSDCADTLVGDSSHRGLSGGEKRRLSLAIQLLSNPSLLFLDEPTTGLDASSAFLLVQTCKRLAKNGRTIIMSIHQPRSDIFFLFDRLVVLAKGGKVAFADETKNAIPYFQSLGFELPLHVNPADFIIDTCAIDSRTEASEYESVARVNIITDEWKKFQANNSTALRGLDTNITNAADTNTALQLSSSGKAPLFREIVVSAKRQFVISYRDPLGYIGLLAETLILAIVVGWVFYKLDDSIQGMRSMQGALYICISMQGYLLFIYETYRLCCSDMSVFDRELADGCVSVTGFLISRRLSKVFTEDLFVPLIYAVITFFMTGMEVSARQFFIFFSCIFLCHYNSVFYATMAAAISRDFAVASLIGNLFFTLQFMASGYFANPAHLPVYVRWTKWISTYYYILTVAYNNQFANFFGNCPFPQSDARCMPYSGRYIIEMGGFRLSWIAQPFGIVTAMAVTFYFLAWAILKYFPVSLSLAQGPKSSGEIKTLAEAEKTEKSSHYEREMNPNGPVIDLQDLKLSIYKPFAKVFNMKNPKSHINILNGVTAQFIPGSINAILGPSGSGKSSLLNLMAARLNSTPFSKYQSSVNTSLFFNGQTPTAQEVANLCSFVTQEDDGLLPSLTVRETLHYAADLRLPPSVPKAHRHKIADDVIRRMGLKYCADTPIGDEMVKGISGGEKRRVTISIQLLNDPDILLLDEPTSGLDAFTAASILDVLVSLAKEGRTIVCTIHQPRSDMFQHFGNILLLAKGGLPAYNGPPRELFPYLNKIGYPCPQLTNPADHLLDLVSVNYQTKKKEERTKMLVRSVLECWEAEQQALDARPRLEAGEHSGAAGSQDGAFKHESNTKAISEFATLKILVHRSGLNILRSPHLIAARIMQVFGMSIILVLYFAPLNNLVSGIPNRLGIVQQVTALYFVGMLNNIAVYPAERSVFYREFDDGVYGVLPFFMSYTIVELPFELVTALMFSTLYTLATGLGRNVDTYFICVFCVLVIVNCGESIGIAFNTIFLHEGFAINVISMVLSIATIMAGLLSLQMPRFFRVVNWVSPIRYSVAVLTQKAFPESLQISCEGQPIDPNTGKCAFNNGAQVLELYGLKNPVKSFLGALAVCLVMYRLLAFVVLKVAKMKSGVKLI